MKRLLFIIMTFVLCSANIMSQSQMAVLSHNGDIKVFYGYEALEQACEEIENGDVITLSSGNFKATNIGAAITVRGEGMEDNEANGRRTTYISGDFSVYAEVGTDARMSFEGIFFTGTVHSWENMDYLSFNKCKFTKDGYPGGVFSPKGTVVKKCIFTNCKVQSIYMEDSGVVGYNSIFGAGHHGNYYHCIMFFGGNGHDDQFEGCRFIDGIAIANGHVYWLDSNYFNGTIIVRRLMAEGAEDLSQDYYFHMSDAAKGVVTFVATKSGDNYFAVFKNNVNTWSLIDRSDFELLDVFRSLPSLTTDGTECGVYGGTLPYSPYLDMPTITNLKVNNHSDENGKLGVDVEVME